MIDADDTTQALVIAPGIVPEPGYGLGIDLAIAAATEFLAASRSDATRRAYMSDWRHFEAWCLLGGLITLPAQPATVAVYLSSMAGADPPARVSTIRRRVAAIAHMHRATGFENPASHSHVRAVLTGIARTLGSRPDKKTALRAADISSVIRKIKPDLSGIRDRALILIGFAAALRRSELVALDIADISRSAKGIVLLIRRSKTDQEGAGITKAVPHGRKLRPVAALDGWLGELAARGVTTGPLFRGVHGPTVLPGRCRDAAGTLPGRLSDQQVAAIIKKRVAAAGLDPKLFAGHSLRSGFITSAAESGASLEKIASHAAHTKLETTRGYIQVADAFKDHSGSGFL